MKKNTFGGRKRKFASATLFMHDSVNRNFKNCETMKAAGNRTCI